MFPNILAAPVPSVTLVNLTTMDRSMQNAYSRQASVEVERQIGDERHDEHRLSVRARAESHHLDQPERADVRGRGHEQRLPSQSRTTPTTVSIRPRPSRTITACMCRSCSGPTAWGHYRVSYTLSKSMNNVGENFFSSPIDPTDLSKDWGRSDDDQRHRLVVNGAVDLPYRFDLSGALQAYSALPFNILSGVTTIQGTAARPDRERRVHRAQCRCGERLLHVSARLSRSFSVSGPRRDRRRRRDVQPHQSRQCDHAEHEFRTGRVS